MRISQEIKDNIIKLFNEKKTNKEILEQFKISKSSLYRIIKEYKKNDSSNNDNNTSNNSNNNDNKESSESSEAPSGDNSNESTEENNNDNKSSNNSSNNNIDKSFDKNEFLNELNNDNNDNNTESSDTTEFNENIEVKKNSSFISLKENNTKLNTSVKSLKKYNNNNNINNRSTIIDTLNNLNNLNNIDDIDLAREKRGLIIRIRQYINKYHEVLKILYGNRKQEFIRKLYNLDNDKLKMILENVRVEMSLNNNDTVFYNIVETGLRSYEKISCYSGYNIEGLADNLLKDKSFMNYIDQLQCEIDLSEYINPKSSVFIHIIKATYQKYKENEVKVKINNIVNNNDKLEKIKQLDKKIS